MNTKEVRECNCNNFLGEMMHYLTKVKGDKTCQGL